MFGYVGPVCCGICWSGYGVYTGWCYDFDTYKPSEVKHELINDCGDEEMSSEKIMKLNKDIKILKELMKLALENIEILHFFIWNFIFWIKL